MITLKNCTTESMGGTRTRYTFTDTTPRGESIVTDFTACHPDNSDRHSLPNLWHEHGFTPSVLSSYWAVDVYATQPDGLCLGRYNPTEKRRKDAPGMVLNFAWMLPATTENRDKILAEIIRRANKEA